jgi:hypothetical protein
MSIERSAPNTAERPPPSGRSVAVDPSLSAATAAADFERWLEDAQRQSGTEPYSASGSEPQPRDAPADTARKDTGASGERQEDQRAAADTGPPLPLWAALSFGAGTPASEVSPSPAAGASSATWAEVSASIERLLVGDVTAARSDTAALFRLAPELLRDTRMALSRTDAGWSLRIDSSDPWVRSGAAQHQALLRARFASAGLGELTVEQGELPELDL